MKYKIFKAIFLIWIVLWLFFIARELFIKGAIEDYKELLLRSLEGKRSYVTGDKLYEFLTFCNENLPPDATYGLEGVEEDSLDKRRAVYYLYPHLEKKTPAFVLVYGKAHITKDGYRLYRRLDETRYMLKKED
jgi:hypothetical protein